MEYNITSRQKDKGWQYIISYKDKNGKWRQKSKQGFELSREGKRKGKEWAMNTLKELEGTFTLNSNLSDITFKDFTTLFLEDKSDSIQHNTIDTYKKAFNRFSDLDNIKVKNIKNIDVQKIVNKMLKSGCKVSTSSLYLYKIKTCLYSAVNDYNIILTNPIKKITFPKEDAKTEKEALTLNESKILLNKLINKNIKYYIFTLLGLKCGLRASEIVGLTWDCIDLKNKTLRVEKQWKYDKDKKVYSFGSLKSNNSYRTIPISKFVVSELNKYKSTNPIPLDNRVLNYATTDSITSHLRKEFHALGFNISPHNLRHTYATSLIAKGLDFRTVANLMGHTMQETIKTYSHVTDEMIERAKDLIEII
ncbi:tyrosine-type recombinase/integrase [Clostridium paraputrificum]|uniref:tyrosine-type recombinase/integrase n=1 Tax=Clostridium paraputrificum TaxID=29363 RepID=UPI00232E0A36|nr:tyrosine-type recombinase/integrase [Clostridium paraputrificum]MDB2075669.1 tyrosine-type recombinase/integrase [Clostridium paraputrificum]MDB2079935.1 tyrosine-type recombinase/integrase [Clostridium paraputrificum]